MYGHNHHQHQQQGAILDKSNGQKVPGASSDVGALEERWNQHHWRWRLLVEPGGESVAHVERLLLTSLIACLLARLLAYCSAKFQKLARRQLPDKGGRCAAESKGLESWGFLCRLDHSWNPRVLESS
jgi:hypothetical protein